VPLLVKNSPFVHDKLSFFEVDSNSIIIESVKKAEDSGALIVRLYEAAGGRCTFNLKTTLPVKSVALCNMLEHDLADHKPAIHNGSIQLSAQPFQILSVKLYLQ